jgi:hypothetical protein
MAKYDEKYLQNLAREQKSLATPGIEDEREKNKSVKEEDLTDLLST